MREGKQNKNSISPRFSVSPVIGSNLTSDLLYTENKLSFTTEHYILPTPTEIYSQVTNQFPKKQGTYFPLPLSQLPSSTYCHLFWLNQFHDSSSTFISCVPKALPLLQIPQNSLHVVRYPSLISAPALSAPSHAPNYIEDKTQTRKQKVIVSASPSDDSSQTPFIIFTHLQSHLPPIQQLKLFQMATWPSKLI